MSDPDFSLGRALMRDDDDRAVELLRDDPTLPWRGVFDLVALGYGVASLDEGRAELVAAEPSRARLKPDAW